MIETLPLEETRVDHDNDDKSKYFDGKEYAILYDPPKVCRCNEKKNEFPYGIQISSYHTSRLATELYIEI